MLKSFDGPESFGILEGMQRDYWHHHVEDALGFGGPKFRFGMGYLPSEKSTSSGLEPMGGGIGFSYTQTFPNPVIDVYL